MTASTPPREIHGVSRECLRDDHSYCWRSDSFGGAHLICDCWCHDPGERRR